jgi:hypothetical protein
MMLDRLELVEAKVDRLAIDVKVQLEDLRDTVNKFTDTMGARFDALDRRLEERDKQFAASFLDIKRVLTNHNNRITALEHPPRRRT